MKFNKETILILAGGILLIIGWYSVMHRLDWIPKRTVPTTDAVPAKPSPPPSETETPPAETTPEETVVPTEVVDNQPAENGKTPAPTMPEAPPEQLVELTSSDGKATFFIDGQSGGIVTVRLQEYEPYGEKGSGDSIRLGSWKFPFCTIFLGEEREAQASEVTHEDDVVRLTRWFENGLRLQESWRFLEEIPYHFFYTASLSNDGETPVVISPLVAGGGLTGEGGKAGPKMSRVGTIDLAVDIAPNLRQRPVSFPVAKDRIGNRKFGKFTADQCPVETAQPAAWFAVHNKYFAYLLKPVVPDESEDRFFSNIQFGLTEKMTAGDGPEADEFASSWVTVSGALGTIELAPGAPAKVFEFEGYAGPKKLKLLSELAPNADAIMRLDYFMFFRAAWMGLIAKTILRSLVALNGFFGGPWGFGFAIIVVTVVIKTLFWPLTHKSTVSMRRMAKLQPEIKKLREQYKDDPQVLNRKTMEFYRENKVNPAGGCLPMLLQIPVFFALFNTLRGAVELRHAAFLYISDLSQPDTLTPFGDGIPIRPLAILMGVTMLIQQKLTPTSGDPAQKKMMSFMTLFFMFIFYSMPSGLTLYWTTNQLLTIGQNLVTKRLEARKEAQME